MTVMKPGTTYDQRKRDNKPLVRRFHECKRCGEKIYTNESNFQECMSKALDKCRSK